LALVLLFALACEDKREAKPDAGPAPAPAPAARDAGPRAAPDDGGAPASVDEPADSARTPEDEQVYQLPWRTETNRAVFDLRMPLPSTALLITEDTASPVKRYRERRSDMSFFVERRGLRGLPQTLPLEEAARWYALLYQAQEIQGPVEAVFAGRQAVRMDFRSQQDDDLLHVALFVVFRGGYLYGVGIESTKPKRLAAAAARVALKAKFVSEEPVVEVGQAKTLADLAVKLPGAAELIEARGFGGISLTDRDTRFAMLVSRAPEKDAAWAKDKPSYEKALESQRFPGFTLGAIKPAKLGGQRGLLATYATDGKNKDERVFLHQHVIRANGYAYLFTASSDARYEKELRTWAGRVLKGVGFLRPF
jgi:hypothetical protein